MEERAGERRRAFLLVSPLLGPLPTRSSQGEDGELDVRSFADDAGPDPVVLALGGLAVVVFLIPAE